MQIPFGFVFFVAGCAFMLCTTTCKQDIPAWAHITSFLGVRSKQFSAIRGCVKFGLNRCGNNDTM